MGAHHFDIAQWALDRDRSGPVSIEPPEGDDTKGLRFVYDNGVEMFHGGPDDCTFEGTEGTIHASRGKFAAEPEIGRRAPARRRLAAPPGRRTTSPTSSTPSATAPATVAPAEVGHRTATVCHLAIIGYALRRPLRWDPAAERFVDDDEANALLGEPYREPWTL